MKKLVILIIFPFLLISCTANRLTMDMIQFIEKDSSLDEVTKLIEPKKPKYDFYIQQDFREFHVQIFDMVTGEIEGYGENRIISPMPGNAVASFSFGGFTPPSPPSFPMNNNFGNTYHHQTYTEPYAFVFENEKLYYWGFFEELNKCEDKAINELGPKISMEIERRKQLKVNGGNFKG